MQKISDSTSTATPGGEFTQGSAAGGVPATLITSEWLNAVQRELLTVLRDGGIEQNKEDDGQLSAALKNMFATDSHVHSWSDIKDKPADSLGVWALRTTSGEGRLSLNNADPALATALLVGTLSAEQLNYASTLGSLRKGDTITLRSDAFSLRLRITGDPTDAAGYWSIPVSYVSGARVLPAEGRLLSVAFWPSIASDMLNTVRVNVPSAANINLNTAAPSSRNINITGTTSIAGFTVADGQLFFVRFAATLTLTNSASLVTQSGANIITQIGDTCILRAIAPNVVEVLCYTQGVRQDLGYGQAWQDVTASRAANTTYTNTTGRPMVVSVSLYTADAVPASLIVNGVAMARRYAVINNYTDLTLQLIAIVPPGASYSLQASGSATIRIFSEMK